MKKEKSPRNKRPWQSGNSISTQMQASVEIQPSVSMNYRCSEKEYERLFIREPEVKAREGKMAYVRLEYHEHIMCTTHVIGHDSLSLSVRIDHVLTRRFNQCEETIRSPYARNYNSVF